MTEYGIIGYPLEHSYSGRIFNLKFEKEGIDARYRLFPIPSIEEFPEILAIPGLRGLNVTSPYKEQVIPYLDKLCGQAAEIRAVNTVKLGPEGITGHNTDIIGFTRAYEDIIGPEPKKALVLGTGGASKAAVFALRNMGHEAQLVSRKKTPETITYDELTPEVMEEHKIIVNGTPMGMTGVSVGEAAPIPYELLTPQHICIDMIYNPKVTEFLHRAGLMGATTAGGIEMLKAQAVAAWEIWNS